MNKIEVCVLNEAHENPAGMTKFLGCITQRNHSIKNMDELIEFYGKCMDKPKAGIAMATLPHGTIQRFSPITIAIVGASRRFLAQARTNQVGFDYVSGSLQYSTHEDVSEEDFVVPYELVDTDVNTGIIADDIWQGNGSSSWVQCYLSGCMADMNTYKAMVAAGISNDTAGYKAPQGLRNILIMQGNHEAWKYFLRLRGCNRNTPETQYVAMLIWEALLKTTDGQALFEFAGSDCMFGSCREGKMCCGVTMKEFNTPQEVISHKWPLI